MIYEPAIGNIKILRCQARVSEKFHPLQVVNLAIETGFYYFLLFLIYKTDCVLSSLLVRGNYTVKNFLHQFFY